MEKLKTKVLKLAHKMRLTLNNAGLGAIITYIYS